MTTPTVTTEAGRLSGSHTDGVTRYLGIPYAAAPADGHRFAPPAPTEPWTGTREARDHGATAPQPALHPANAHLTPLTGPGWIRGDGQYLNLNVWTPDTGTRGLPVMVCIHGGGFVIGSGGAPAFDGTSFARDGVVLVTVNYRLGAEGFLAPSGGSTNVGLRDQIAALQWVRDDITGFGGDPDQVTLLGESAGGTSVALLLHSPVAAGLFRRAIVQSGQPPPQELIERSAAALDLPGDASGYEQTARALSAVPLSAVPLRPRVLRASTQCREHCPASLSVFGGFRPYSLAFAIL
jgi:para-nitrobenzyl esterase